VDDTILAVRRSAAATMAATAIAELVAIMMTGVLVVDVRRPFAGPIWTPRPGDAAIARW
jgi:hypothetical protein